MKDRIDDVEANQRAKRSADAVRNVSDSASKPEYGGDMKYQPVLRAAAVEAQPVDTVVSPADGPLPASLYRTINLRAWLVIFAAGVLGWVLLLKLL